MTALWIGVGLLAWLTVATGVGVVLGAAVRRRDRQVPSNINKGGDR